MYFRNYRLRKTGLKKSLKSPFSEVPSTSTMLKGPHAIEISMAPPFTYVLITVKTIELEEISDSDM